MSETNSQAHEQSETRNGAPALPYAELFGYRVHLIDTGVGLNWIQARIQQGKNTHVVTLNPEMIMQGDQNTELSDILKAADLQIPDGTGVVWALKSRGHQIKRLPGIEFAEALLQLANEQGYRVALIGARVGVLMHAIDQLHQRYPRLQISYFHHGFFSTPEEEASIAQACAQSKPSIVLVAMGAPRQEQWIARYKHLFEATVFVGVGGSLDVWSGEVQRAPRWMRKLSLEWLYRVVKDPARIGRICKTLPVFVVKVWMSRFQK